MHAASIEPDIAYQRGARIQRQTVRKERRREPPDIPRGHRSSGPRLEHRGERVAVHVERLHQVLPAHPLQECCAVRIEQIPTARPRRPPLVIRSSKEERLRQCDLVRVEVPIHAHHLRVFGIHLESAVEEGEERRGHHYVVLDHDDPSEPPADLRDTFGDGARTSQVLIARPKLHRTEPLDLSHQGADLFDLRYVICGSRSVGEHDEVASRRFLVVQQRFQGTPQVAGSVVGEHSDGRELCRRVITHRVRPRGVRRPTARATCWMSRMVEG